MEVESTSGRSSKTQLQHRRNRIRSFVRHMLNICTTHSGCPRHSDSIFGNRHRTDRLDINFHFPVKLAVGGPCGSHRIIVDRIRITGTARLKLNVRQITVWLRMILRSAQHNGIGSQRSRPSVFSFAIHGEITVLIQTNPDIGPFQSGHIRLIGISQRAPESTNGKSLGGIEQKETDPVGSIICVISFTSPCFILKFHIHTDRRGKRRIDISKSPYIGSIGCKSQPPIINRVVYTRSKNRRRITTKYDITPHSAPLKILCNGKLSIYLRGK